MSRRSKKPLHIIKEIAEIFVADEYRDVDRDMQIWRKRICDATFYFFSIFGFFTYIPSLVLSIREGAYVVAGLSTILYGYCVYATLARSLSYRHKAISGAVLFYIVGSVMLFLLGPRGAGQIWLFSTTILVALLLGNTGAIISFCVVSLTQIAFLWYRHNAPGETGFGVTFADWTIQAINFILLNLAFVIAQAIFTRGFKSLIARSRATRNASIIGLAKLAEYRDHETGAHLLRMQRYTGLIAEELARHSEYRGYINDEYIEDLRISSILHDIGKVGIQDAILLKPGPLSDAEFSYIKQHPSIGGDVIGEIEKNVSGRSLYTLSKEIALYHHERWDGTGYPEGRSERNIPLAARITALADVYDALTSQRIYKDAISHDRAVEIIKSGRGTQFDPDIVDVFLKVSKRFMEIARLWDQTSEKPISGTPFPTD